jgi:hypothetical protein
MVQAGEIRRRDAEIQRQRRLSINPEKTCCGAAILAILRMVEADKLQLLAR